MRTFSLTLLIQLASVCFGQGEFEAPNVVMAYKVRVDKEQVRFRIETGWSPGAHILDMAHFGNLKRITGSPRYQSPDLYLSELRVANKNDPSMLFDLGFFKQVDGASAGGILTMTELRLFKLVIDPNASRVEIRPGRSESRPEESTEIIYEKGVPTIVMEIGGRDIRVRVVTSVMPNELQSDLFKRLLEMKVLDRIGGIRVVETIGPQKGPQIIRVGFSRCKIGSHHLPPVMFKEGDMNAIGVDVLRKFIWEFDFPKKRAYFRPSKFFKETADYNVGLSLRVADKKVVVSYLTKKDEAWKAGLRPGDIIVSQKKEAVGSNDVWSLRHQLTRVKGDHEFEITRAGKAIIVVVKNE